VCRVYPWLFTQNDRGYVIYAIHAVDTEFVKFGKADKIKRRLINLQVSSPHELRVIAQADWPDSAEALIHALLRQSRVRGEWFRLDKPTIGILGLMREEAGLSKLEELGSGPPVMGSNTLKRLFHLTKEDFGIWRTSGQWTSTTING
jgi:hypothetical protein